MRLRGYDGMGAAAAARRGRDRWGYADVTTETAGTEGTHNADAGATDEYENESLNVEPDGNERRNDNKYDDDDYEKSERHDNDDDNCKRQMATARRESALCIGGGWHG